MNNKNMLARMMVIMVTKHDGQFDKGGVPYAFHPFRVMEYLHSDDEELNCIALGHDLVEDTDITYEFLREEGFTNRVIGGIKGLTKIPGESYAEYKEKVKSNPDCIRVKMCDLRHNCDVRRLKGVTEKDIKRIEKYHSFYLELKQLLEKGC